MDNHKYDDIINLPHHRSKKHPQMPIADRAAQFAPFAALTGHGAAIDETERLTAARIELDEYEKDEISNQIQLIQEHLKDETYQVKITYFVADTKKSGGSYCTINGHVKKIKLYERILQLNDGQKICMDDVIAIETMCD